MCGDMGLNEAGRRFDVIIHEDKEPTGGCFSSVVASRRGAEARLLQYLELEGETNGVEKFDRSIFTPICHHHHL